MIYLDDLRLGPTLQGLEQFVELESLHLAGNFIEEIAPNAFEKNLKLNYLVLEGNRISEITGLKDLPDLQYVDLSNNDIEKIDATKQLPQSLLFLKLKGNPMQTKTKHKQALAYRKPLVLALPNLVELDRIEILVAERLSY